MKSLGQAIVVRVASALVVVGMVSVVSAYLAAQYETNQFMDDFLRQFSAVIDPSAEMPKVRALLEPEDRFERLVWKGGTRISASADAPAIYRQPADLGFADVVDRGTAWRIFTSERGGLVMMLAQKASSRQEMAQHAAVEISLVIIGTMLAVWLIVGWSVSLIMRRLGKIGSSIAERSLDATDALGLERIPLEIKPLIAAMNMLIGRLQRALTQQRSFVADSAHELRTPLSALRIQIDNLSAISRPGAEAAAIDALGEGIARASGVVSQLLRLARLDDLQSQNPEPVDLGNLMTQCVADFVDIAERSDIDLGVGRIDAAEVQSVPGDLQHLFSNLIDNAIRYTPAGGRVDCEIARTSKGAVAVITDTGPGVRPEDLRRLTERFFRAAAIDIPGSGLGLSIVKAIADAHGLTLDIANRADRSGLTVAISFPRRIDL